MLSYGAIRAALLALKVDGEDLRDAIATEILRLDARGGELLERVGSAHPTADGRSWVVHSHHSVHLNDQNCYVLRPRNDGDPEDNDYGDATNKLLLGTYRKQAGELEDMMRAVSRAWNARNFHEIEGVLREFRKEWGSE